MSRFIPLDQLPTLRRVIEEQQIERARREALERLEMAQREEQENG
jgi:hypothetical protein